MHITMCVWFQNTFLKLSWGLKTQPGFRTFMFEALGRYKVVHSRVSDLSPPLRSAISNSTFQ